MKIKYFLQWLARRSEILLTLLLLGGAIVVIWVLITGVTIDEKATVIIAAISIFFAAISAFASLLQVVEAQRQREDNERPNVISYFEASNNGAFYFVIENIGNSPSYDLKIQFTPSPIDYAGRSINDISLFKNPITFLPPSKPIRQIVGATFLFFENNKETNFHNMLNYKSVTGKTFNEEIIHDLEYLRHVTLPGKVTNDYLKEISENLKELNKGISKLTSMPQKTPIKKKKSKA